MKSILCFGDSNTWGYIPGGSGRYPWGIRWTSILQERFGNSARIIEEGLCGRTTTFDDPFSDYKNGRKFLPIVLDTHSPIDLAIIMLGTNDVKVRVSQTAFTIAQGAAELVELCKAHEPPVAQVLLVAPAPITSTDEMEYMLPFENSIEKSKELAKYYKYFAEKLGCQFFDAGTVAKSSPIDGIHLDETAHLNLGEALYLQCKKFL